MKRGQNTKNVFIYVWVILFTQNDNKKTPENDIESRTLPE